MTVKKSITYSFQTWLAQMGSSFSLLKGRLSRFFLQLGYIIYRRVLRYYSGEEDGLGETC